MSEIKINGDAVSPSLSKLHTKLQEYEESLVDLNKELLMAQQLLKGKAYSTLLDVTETFVNQQKDLLIHEKMVQTKIENYITDMVAKERRSKPKFSV